MNSVNKLILGTVQMGLPYGVNNNRGKISTDESFKILNEAYSAGIRTLDTAEVYGDAHRVIGVFHKNNPEQKFNVVTKIPAGREKDDIENIVQRYLDQLQVEKLEALMFHSFASYESQPAMPDELMKLKSAGLLRYVGVSAYTNPEVEALIQDSRIDLIQLPFNLLDNHSLRGELLENAKKADKIIHTRSAFLQGLFFKNPDDSHPVVGALREQLKRIQYLSESVEQNIATLALQYCLQQGYIDNVLIGVDSVKQLKQNVKAVTQHVESELFDEIDKIIVKNYEILNPSNWKKIKL